MTAFLDGIQTRRPKKQGRFRIDDQTEVTLQETLVFNFSLNVGFGIVGALQILVGARIKDGIRCVEDTGGTTGVILVDDFLP